MRGAGEQEGGEGGSKNIMPRYKVTWKETHVYTLLAKPKSSLTSPVNSLYY